MEGQGPSVGSRGSGLDPGKPLDRMALNHLGFRGYGRQGGGGEGGGGLVLNFRVRVSSQFGPPVNSFGFSGWLSCWFLLWFARWFSWESVGSREGVCSFVFCKKVCTK